MSIDLEAMTERNSVEVYVDNVSKIYEKEGETQVVLKDCSFMLERGKLTALMGPSGCGKTVLVNLIAGYEKPTAGTIYMGGTPVESPGYDRMVVFQESALFPWMTVYGNVVFSCRIRGIPESEIQEKADFILRKVGLFEFKDKYPSQLSGGMQRRAELARAMINDPKIMILDEPFRGLDAMTRQLMQEFYVALFEEVGRTTLFITHEIDEALFLADRLAIMTYQPGKIKQVIDIDLPRPRKYEILATSRFMELRVYALELLYEEAIKAFSSGVKEAFDLIGALQSSKDSCQLVF